MHLNTDSPTVAGILNAIEDIADGLLVAEAETFNILRVSRSLADWLGVPSSRLVGSSVADWLTPEAGRRLARSLADVKSTQIRIPQLDWTHADGFDRCADLVMTPIASGGVSIWVGFLRDVTAVRRLNVLLDLQRDLGSRINGAKGLPIALEAVVDTLLQLEGIDAAVAYIVRPGGIDAAVHRGVSPELVESIRSLDSQTPQYQLAMQGRTVYGPAHTLPSPIDEQCWSERVQSLAVVPVIHSGQVIGALVAGSRRHESLPVSIVRSIEVIAAGAAAALARFKAEEALREKQGIEEEARLSDLRFRAVVENAAVGVVVADAAGGILECNNAFAEMLGYAPSELVGRDYTEITVPGEAAEEQKLFGEVITGQRPSVCIDKIYVHRNGSRVQARLAASVVRDDRGELRHLIGAVQDITAWKAAEQSLLDIERKFLTYIEQSSFGYLEMDLELQIQLASAQAGRILRCEAGQLVGRRLPELLVEEDHRALEELMGRDASEAMRPRTFRVACSEGDPCEIELFVLPNERQGRTVGYLSSFQDVSAQRAMERAVQRSETRLRVLLENLPDNVVILRRDGTAEYVNHVPPGVTLEEAMRTCCLQFVAAEHSELGAQCLNAVFESREPQEFVACAVWGRWYDTRLVPLPASEGEPLVLSISTDITEQRNAERELADREIRLHSLFGNLPDLVFVVGKDEEILFANRGLGPWRREDLEGRNAVSLLAPEHRSVIVGAHERAYLDKAIATLEVQDVFGSWWVTRIVPIVRDDDVLQCLVINTDITEQRLAREAIRKEQQLLRDLLELHERDRQVMAYEIHDGVAQHLTAAAYAFEVVRGRLSGDADNDFQRGVSLLSRAIDDARRLISGVRPPVLDELGIMAAVEYLVNECRMQKGVEVELISRMAFDRLAPPLENAVFRIVQESLANACRHSGSSRLSVELVQREARLCIAVRDWGCGFDPGQTPEGRFGMRGIRERVRLLGGDVSITSAPGQGTIVSVELPIVRPPAPTSQEDDEWDEGE